MPNMRFHEEIICNNPGFKVIEYFSDKTYIVSRALSDNKQLIANASMFYDGNILERNIVRAELCA